MKIKNMSLMQLLGMWQRTSFPFCIADIWYNPALHVHTIVTYMGIYG